MNVQTWISLSLLLVATLGRIQDSNAHATEVGQDQDGSAFSPDGLRTLFREASAKHEFGAAVALVADAEGIVFLEAFGEIEPGVPMTTDAIFRHASITKPMTAVVILMLCEEGRLRLDEPVERHIPEFGNVAVRTTDPDADDGELEAVRRPITVADLLTHTAGLTVRGPEVAAFHGEAKTTLELARSLAGLPLAAQPGAVYDYGWYGSSYEVLGALIEIITGETLDRVFAKRIYEPLGMTDTFFAVPEEKLTRLAAMYQRRDEGLAVVVPRGSQDLSNRSFRSAGGGTKGTVEDYHRFARMLLGKGELDGVRLLKPESIELMTTDHVGDLYPDESGEYGWGYGVRVRRRRTADSAGSAGAFGWLGGTGTIFWVDPDLEQIGVVFTSFVPPANFQLLNDAVRVASESIAATPTNAGR